MRRRWLLWGVSLVLVCAAVVALTTTPGGHQASTSTHRVSHRSPARSRAARTVPCALSHAAGANGTNSCWATHTGVQGATGYTEAQIEAGAPGFTRLSGVVAVTRPGTVIDHKWINGCVAINSGASNVIIRDSLVTDDGGGCKSNAGDTHPSAINDGADGGSLPAPTGLVIEDTTIDGRNAPGDTYGVDFVHGSCIRCNVTGFTKGFWTGSNTAASPSLYKDDYVHDMNVNDQCSHMNGWFLWSSTYAVIEHSYAIMDQPSRRGDGCVTGAISLQSPSPRHVKVDDSYMEGVSGADFTGGCPATDIVITNNALSARNGYHATDFVTYWAAGPGNVWSGNYVPEWSNKPAAAGGRPRGC